MVKIGRRSTHKTTGGRDARAPKNDFAILLTFNLDDFPKAALELYGIEAVPPEQLALQLIQSHPAHVLQAVKDHRLSLSRPPKTVDQYLATLEKQKLPKTVAFLREHKGEL